MVEYGLIYIHGDGVKMTGFTDVDWARSIVDRERTSGCFFQLGIKICLLVQQEAEVSGVELC